MNDPSIKNRERERLENKIKLLNEAVWEHRVNNNLVTEWIAQFNEQNTIEYDEQIQVLFLLSHFLYFGQSELRNLLKSLYRDLIRTPIIHEIRRLNNDILDYDMIEAEYKCRLSKVRFLAIGNPSESSTHLLYYFRQENALPKNLFINTHEIFRRDALGSQIQNTIRNPEIDQYIFIDDLCGSGTQARLYSKDIVSPLKDLSDTAKVSYLVLFATTEGLKAVRGLDRFDTVNAVYELDSTFKTFGEQSRIFVGEEGPFNRLKIRDTCQKYGLQLLPKHPLGYKDGQLLIGFSHNTPDNTLPIFWGGDQSMDGPWKAVFQRYEKVY